MSWRDILGTDKSTNNSGTHNSQNTHNHCNKDNSADIADCAEVNSKLLETLAAACEGLAITPKEVKDALAPEDIEYWRNGDTSIEALNAFAHALTQRREMDQGKRPAHFTKQATCKNCGPVWLWFSGEVLGCPWCWNRVADRPIPRPCAAHCADCEHFNRIDHPHLGHCAKGEPEAIAGLWGTDQRHCKRYLPKQMNEKTNDD